MERVSDQKRRRGDIDVKRRSLWCFVRAAAVETVAGQTARTTKMRCGYYFATFQIVARRFPSLTLVPGVDRERTFIHDTRERWKVEENRENAGRNEARGIEKGKRIRERKKFELTANPRACIP